MKKRSLLRDIDDDTVVIGFLGDAFRLRNGESYLSAAWAEYYSGDPRAQVRSAIDHFRTLFTVKNGDRFAVGNVGAIKSACDEFGLSVRIVREPEPNHPAHAAVRRFKDDNLELLEMLATEAWAEIVSP